MGFRLAYPISVNFFSVCACFIYHDHFVLQRSDFKNKNKDFLLIISNYYDPKIWYFYEHKRDTVSEKLLFQTHM